MSEKRKHSRLADVVLIVLALCLVYVAGYPLIGTPYRRPSELHRAFASEIALAYKPMGKLEAIVRGQTVVFYYHDERPPHEQHSIRFDP